jgi:hypothetical protein
MVAGEHAFSMAEERRCPSVTTTSAEDVLKEALQRSEGEHARVTG